MKKIDLANRVAEKLNVPPENAMEMVEAVMNIIKHAVQLGETVKIPLFGNFVVRQKRARIGRNPKTGQEAEITARRVVTFCPSLSLRRQVDAVNTATEIAPEPSVQWESPVVGA
jgi:integration host factor subunit alpha